MFVGYTMESDPDISAKAIGRDMPVSPKFARETAGMIRGMRAEDAAIMLEEVMEKQRAVPLKRHNKRVAHKAGIGPGRYPVKVAKAILFVLESAMSNAEYKGLDVDNMIISTISVSRGVVIPGHKARAQGRATPWNQETVNIEVILEEVE